MDLKDFKKFALITTIFLLVGNILYSNENIIISESKDKLNIQFINIKPEIKVIDGKKVIAISGWEKFEESINSQFLKYRFTFASGNISPKIEYQIISTNTFAASNPVTYNLKHEITVELNKQRIVRGINLSDIRIIPYYYEPHTNQIIYAESISIDIDLNIQVSPKLIDLHKEETFFADVINRQHIGSLINSRNKLNSNKTAEKFLSTDWYNPNLNYAKIQTTKDEIVRLKIIDVSAYLPHIIGKNPKYLNLINRGENYPYFLLDEDGIISDNDELVFFGKRPVGDTTWFNSYTNFEAFFLCYDENSEGKRLSEMSLEDNQDLPLYNNVEIFKHIEHDKVYGIGTEFISNYFDGSIEKSNYNDSRTVPGEGWFWATIAPNGVHNDVSTRQFVSDIFIDPSDNENDKLKISVYYQTNQDSISRLNMPDVMTYYDLYYNLNEKFQKRDSITGFKIRSLSNDGNFSSLLPGLNRVKVESKQVYIETNERVNIDYITLEGKSKTYAYKDKIEFKGFAENLKVNLQGFVSDKIHVIDTKDNKYKIYNHNTKGTIIRAGGVIDELTAISIGIADSIIYSELPGVHIFSYDFVTGKYLYERFNAIDTRYNTYLRSLPNTSAVAVVIASKDNLEIDFSELNKVGGVINKYQAKSVYSAIFITKTNHFKEKLNPKNASLSEYFIHDEGIQYGFDIPLESSEISNFVISGSNSINSSLLISDVKISNLQSTGDLDAIFITHKDFLEQTEILADYRRKTQGLKIEVVDVEDIYKEFNFGNKSPHPIKQFLDYSYRNRDITHILLVGDASWDARKVLKNSISTDWVPTYGYPASDWWYICLDGDDDLSPDMVMGRIPANSNEQLKNYVDKSIVYDTTIEQPWMKNFLFLIGGYQKAEIDKFKSRIYSHYSKNILNPDLCGIHTEVVKSIENTTTSAQGGEIRAKINQGAAWTIYIGHAAAELFDLDGWNVSTLNNKDRYGILTTVSCNTGAFAEPLLIASRNEQYTLEKDKGFVAATGASFTGFEGQHNNITSRMIAALADTTKKMRHIGDLMNYGKANLSIEEPLDRITLSTYCLIGDPLTLVRVGTMPDAYIPENSLSIVNQSGNTKFSDQDETVIIEGSIYNYGYCFRNNLDFKIIREYNQQFDTVTQNYSQLCYFDNFSIPFIIKNKPGRHKFTIKIDPENKVEELNKNNNTIVFYIDVFKDGLLTLDPQGFWDVSSSKPKFRLINPFQDEYTFDYQFLITSSIDTTEIVYKTDTRTSPDEVVISENTIDWIPDLSIKPASYWLHARFINKVNSTWSEWLSFPFNSNPDFDKSKVSAIIKSNQEFILGKSNDLMLTNVDNKEALYLKRDTFEFKSIGVKGNRADNPDGLPFVSSLANIEVGGKVFVDGPSELGFNIVTLKFVDGEIVGRHKRFETWGLGLGYPIEDHFTKDSTAFRLVEFLRDSIADDEYLLLATCQSSFRLPMVYKSYGEPGNYASVDTLLYYLNQFGSVIADTLKIDKDNRGEEISFAMMGYRGATPGTIPESIHFRGDSAIVRGKLISFSKTGFYESPVISKSKEWKSINIESDYVPDGSQVVLSILSVNSENGSIDTIKKVNNPITVNISDINSKKYPDLQVRLDFYQTNSDILTLLNQNESTVNSIKIDFIPADEFAISKIHTNFDKTELMRGDELKLSSKIENISLRNDVDSLSVGINVSRGNSDNDFRDIQINNLQADESIIINHDIITDFLDYQNSVSLNINYDEKLNEFYGFNNSFTLPLNLHKDTIKPNVVLKIDEKYHKYGDYISKLPLFEVELFDNSPLSITDSSSITVRVNGYLHPFQRTLWSEFVTVNDGTNLKAIFRFIPDTLQYEDASIIVYFSDNEGNKDTLTTMARLSLYNAYSEDVISYPNPTDNELNISLIHKAPEKGMKAIVDITDVSGNTIDIIEQTLDLGTNIIHWKGRHKSGMNLPSGVYLYRIKYHGEFYIEPSYGKFIIAR